MPYTKRIVCLANSFKTGGHCIAGREITPIGYGGWIRPVSDRAKEELNDSECQYPNRNHPKLLDIIEISFLRHHPNQHQTENHVIDSSRRWIKRGELSLTELEDLLEYPETLWTNSERTATGLLNCVSRRDAKRHGFSLHLIEGSGLTIWVMAGRSGNRAYYGVFSLGEHLYKLSITDPAVRSHYESFKAGKYPLPGIPDAFLCISLTEPYEWDRRCHKLIAGVITLPPFG